VRPNHALCYWQLPQRANNHCKSYFPLFGKESYDTFRSELSQLK